MDLSGSRPRTTAEISAAVKAKQRPVHHLTDLDVYFKTAEFVGLEAAVYREEENWQELFRVLLAYTSLVVETIRKHKDWTTDASRNRGRAETCKAYEAEVVKCMEEMESRNRESTPRRRRSNRPRRRSGRRSGRRRSTAGAPRRRRLREQQAKSARRRRLLLQTFTEGDWDLLSRRRRSSRLRPSVEKLRAFPRGAQPARSPPEVPAARRGTRRRRRPGREPTRNTRRCGNRELRTADARVGGSKPPPPPPSGYPSVDATRAVVPDIRADTTARRRRRRGRRPRARARLPCHRRRRPPPPPPPSQQARRPPRRSFRPRRRAISPPSA